MSYTSWERTYLYVKYAFDSLLTFSVSSQIYYKLKEIPNEDSEEKGINRPSRRSINYFDIMQKSNFDIIIYSALSIESFINKMGCFAYGDDYAKKKVYKNKTLERCCLGYKMKMIINFIYQCNFDYDAKENDLIRNLFTIRDDLVHDKPEIFNGLFAERKNNNKINMITPNEAFKALLLIDSLFKGYKYNSVPVHFIDSNMKKMYSLFCNDNEIFVDDGLPFNEAKFTDIYLYRYYLRNTIGYEIPVELKNDKIVRKMA